MTRRAPLAALAALLALPWLGLATEGELQRKSPHPTADRPAGCPACHVEEPPEGAAPANARLRIEPSRACATCHPGAAHAGADEHLGQKPALPPTPALPLGPDGSIGCWTCHDVHRPSAARPPRSGLSTALAGPGPAGPVAMLALPADDGALCRACHGVGP